VAGTRRRCVAGFAPLRDAPDEGSEQHSQVLWGDVLTVFEADEGWARVQLPDGYRGWVRADALGPDDGAPPAHVVAEPRADGRYLGTWLVEPADGSEPLADARRRASGAEVVASARRFLGTRYEWGGMTVEGIDCSGLVQVVHRRFGRLLPRDADDQQVAGRPVPVAEAAPGDLLMFGDHVAIVSAPGPTVVHSSGSRGIVLEEPLPDELGGRILEVRRVYPTSPGDD
jgi:cell wall-associated NlpC family hydrolase